MPAEREAFAEAQHAVVAGDEWILDGNYGGTMDVRLAAADETLTRRWTAAVVAALEDDPGADGHDFSARHPELARGSLISGQATRESPRSPG